MGIRRPRYADIASTLALVIALSTGGAYAAHKIHTRDIANSAVTSHKIKKDAVNTNKIKNGQVGFNDLGNGVRNDIVPPWGTIPRGKTVTGLVYQAWLSGKYAWFHEQAVSFPALAPAAPARVGFGSDSFGETSMDPSCKASYGVPTAPAGHVCVYLRALQNSDSLSVGPFEHPGERTRGFVLSFGEDDVDTSSYYEGTWAYTAP